jgi:transposase
VPTRNQDDPKRTALARARTLHPHPEHVIDELFSDTPFFDARDGVQVKYEMLRRVRVDGHSVSRAAASFGLSRPTYYQARDAFERDGIAGLLPDKKGPRRAHKLTPEVLDFVEAELEAEPGITPTELASRIRQEHGVEVHHKSILRSRSRSRSRSEKKPPSQRVTRR